MNPMDKYGFDDEEENPDQEEWEDGVATQIQPSINTRAIPKIATSTSPTKVQGKPRGSSKPMARQQSQLGNFNIDHEIRVMAKVKDLSEEHVATLSAFWQSYFERRPEEMQRLYHLRDENPEEFRAILFTLPGSANRHKLETGYFLMACVGFGCVGLFLITWVFGAFNPDKGWNFAKNKNAIPNIVEALYEGGR
jgi:hypothetical protein